VADIIRYGMGRNYLPDWGFAEALREIYQNFRDFGDFQQGVTALADSDLCEVTMVNGFMPEGHNFMKIGESAKRGVASKVGEHGEGLKMASLVLRRNGCKVVVRYGNTELAGTFYDDPYLGECFGFVVCPTTWMDGFRLTFQVPREEFKIYEESQLDPDKDVIHSSTCGDLLDRPKGEVYVGGHFVSVVDGLQYAYNFNPKFVSLDRDRKVPRDFDVNWAASQILQGWDGMKVKDMVERDASYIDRVPPKIAKKFRPALAKGGAVVFRAQNIQAPDKVAKKLMEMPVNQKRVAKLKFSMSRKRTPHSILKEFMDKYRRHLPAEGKADAVVVLKKAKGWK